MQYEAPQVPPPLYATEPSAQLEVDAAADATLPLSSSLIAQHQQNLADKPSPTPMNEGPNDVQGSQWGWDAAIDENSSPPPVRKATSSMGRLLVWGAVLATLGAVGWAILP